MLHEWSRPLKVIRTFLIRTLILPTSPKKKVFLPSPRPRPPFCTVYSAQTSFLVSEQPLG